MILGISVKIPQDIHLKQILLSPLKGYFFIPLLLYL